MNASQAPFWSQDDEVILARLGASPSGLGSSEARARLARHGANRLAAEGRTPAMGLLLQQVASPLVLILLIGALVSLLLRDVTDAAIILMIVGGSALLGFGQEYRASRAVAALRSRLALTSRVLRDGREQTVAAAELVPGDVLLLAAGNLIPADARVLEATDFLVTEATLTGESFPIEKRPGVVAAADAPISVRTNMVFLGSSVRSGTARALVAATGRTTEFGAIARRLRDPERATDFARGVRQFGAMLMRVMFLIVIFVLAVNDLLGRPFVESMLFAVALAVGLSPELLPAIVSVTLSTGARHLSTGGVIVRRLEAIENFGSMDVLCTDKTGTLTTGRMTLADATDANGRSSSEIRRLAFLNAALETGIANPLDSALVEMGTAEGLTTDGVHKLDEIPYDFQRRRLTIVYKEGSGARTLLSKGAFASVLEVCSSVRIGTIEAPLDAAARQRLEDFYRRKGEDGYRVLALAARTVEAKADYTRDDECDLAFFGFLYFLDPPKDSAAQAIRNLARLGIAIKIISGDNRYVTAHIAAAVGLDPSAMLSGAQLAGMSDEALCHMASRTDLFVEIDPQQKERIVRALQRAGHAVGYLGDGINDAPALRAADIGISVDGAVDVARESADIVLLQPDLGILHQGVEEGRRIFANTLKYISITISANFGNMVSMALATPLLPFLPLLPKQILLNNFLSDLPSLSIATDRVDAEHLTRPQRWDVGEVRRFMLAFGLTSSVFDLLTFAALLFVLHAGEALFQTGWFVVSLMTELAVVLVLRTRRPAWRSRPSHLLLVTTVVVLLMALAFPHLGPIAAAFGLVAPGAAATILLVSIVAAYAAATEMLKYYLYHSHDRGGPPHRRPAATRGLSRPIFSSSR